MSDVRPFAAGDAAGLVDLLDIEPDPLWQAQGHSLHGAARDGARWRRTLVAEREGTVVGAATLARSPVHPTRYSAAVEVAPRARRHGIGTALVAALRAMRPAALPLASKVRERATAPREFVAKLGGTAYQRCLCPTVRIADTSDWAAQFRAIDLTAEPFQSAENMAAAFATMYRWVHASWAPTGDGSEVEDMARRVCQEADLGLSRTMTAGGATAVALAFRAGSRADLVGETLTRATPDGIRLLGGVVSSVLTAAGAAGVETLEFDGHVDDPHLAPLIATLPVAGTDPLLLVEVT